MTEPNAQAMDATELRTFIGKRVQVRRDGALEGTGELLAVVPGEFNTGQVDAEGTPIMEQVEDKALRWVDDTVGEIEAARRYANRWHLTEVE